MRRIQPIVITLGDEPAAQLRPLVTPEGVELHLALATAGERFGAFALDIAINLGLLTGATILLAIAGAAMGGGAGEAVLILWIGGWFVMRNLWFTLFELSAKAATPGKRILKLRVVARDGGRLSGEAVLTRNAMRELEFFLPLTLVAASAVVGDPIDGAMVLAACAWTGVFVVLPLFNRDRMRPGDLLAGTWVVRAPRPALLPDVASAPAALGDPRFGFTADQLAAYGVKELEILEGVLRRKDLRTVRAVAERIRRRIGRPDSHDEPDLDFLQAYYAALRGRLEHRLLFGHRRKDKFDAA
ncbi:MAG TPA: RDD family protein [Caulobacteraceae bacterium]|jgi:uncharacterized RDD family membrane protein YckC|nr:RDD family protein [Caulobacteraceae bacterium]